MIRIHLNRLLFLSGILLIFISQSVLAYTFRPQWVPQAQFAGYYMAAKNGYFQKRGIDIEIKNGGPGIVALSEVTQNKTTFASGLLIAGLKTFEKTNKELVLIGQMVQSNALVLVARRGSGIKSVKQFNGKKLGIWPGDFQVPPKAFIRMKRLRGINIVRQDFNVDSFFEGKMDIASAMMYNELLLMKEKEKDLTVFNFSDMGMKIPEDGIYANRKFYESHPDVCHSFIEEVLRGWRYAFAHKKETAEYITKLANQTDFKTTVAHQLKMLKVMETLIDPNSAVLKKADFNATVSILKNSRLIRKPINYNNFVKGSAIKK